MAERTVLLDATAEAPLPLKAIRVAIPSCCAPQ